MGSREAHDSAGVVASASRTAQPCHVEGRSNENSAYHASRRVRKASVLKDLLRDLQVGCLGIGISAGICSGRVVEHKSDGI